MIPEQHDILDGLNAPQLQAVTTTRGPVLVLAGPGSGKTRVITHRIAYLVQREQVPAWHILAVTFTNKAAREMRERLERLVGVGAAKEMTVGTFHAICARVLRMEVSYLETIGLNKSFLILDGDDQATLIKRAVKSLQLDETQYRASIIQAMISRAKNSQLSPEDAALQAITPLGQVVARVYERYQLLLRSNNSVDFDDLLNITEQLLQNDPGVLRHYQQRWRYLHVDEFQDCNRSQYHLIRLLSYGTEAYHEGPGNICVVGDDDQMIYSWRGASAENIVRFESDFPGTFVILLEQNYRSTQTILDAAQALVLHNQQRKQKRLWTALGRGALIAYHEAYDEEDEGLFVVREISRLLTQGEIKGYGDVAVMYRANVQSRALEEQFLRATVPYRVIGSRKFYERREIKDLLAYLRLLLNQADDLSLLRVINVPNRKIGAKTIGVVQKWASENGLSLYDAVQLIEQHPSLGTSAKNAVRAFGDLMEGLLVEMDGFPLPDLLDLVLERSGYGPELRRLSTEGLDPWSNVLELRRLAIDYAKTETRAALEQFLENVALVGGADTEQTGKNGIVIQEGTRDAVTLITLHAAKGLEYPVVFIVGMDEGALPHARVVDKPDQLEEERRLTYVGFTRAMRQLYLVRATRRSLYGVYQNTEPSRFLEDIPPGFLAPYTMMPIDTRYPNPSGVVLQPSPSVQSETRAPRGDSAQPGGVRAFSPLPQPQPSSSEDAEPVRHLVQYAESAPPQPTRIPPSASPEPSWKPQFKAGVKVGHARYGQGIVLRSEMLSGAEFVEVHFEGEVGNKRLSMDFEKLERV